MSNSNKILFKISGSIAAYKACHVISRLVQAGHEVQVVTTRAALEFVGSATLEGLTGRPVLSETFAAGSYMEHIHLAKWADLVILCPASANTINKLSNGIGDDLVSTLFLAHDFTKPYLMAPAMNTKMYQHPATQAALKKLKDWGVNVLEPASGSLACGDVGEGRLLEPEIILEKIMTILKPKGDLNILITSGGTREPIDGVRSIANMSTGRTGAAIADYMSSRGHQVTLLKATSSVAPSAPTIRLAQFETFADLNQELRELLDSGSFDAVIHAAAVSDFALDSLTVNGQTVQSDATTKLSSEAQISLNLKKNPKLLPQLKSFSPKALTVIGFKLTQNASAAERLAAVQRASPGTDLIVHNDMTEVSEKAHATTIYSDGIALESCANKYELARALEKLISNAKLTKPQEVSL